MRSDMTPCRPGWRLRGLSIYKQCIQSCLFGSISKLNAGCCCCFLALSCSDSLLRIFKLWIRSFQKRKKEIFRFGKRNRYSGGSFLLMGAKKGRIRLVTFLNSACIKGSHFRKKVTEKLFGPCHYVSLIRLYY